jgi:hypothetical protein
MLKQPMIEKLLVMRLPGMAESLKTQEQDPAARELSFLERLGLLVDQRWNWRENQALGRRLKNAKLRSNACVEEIDYRGARGLDKSVIRALAQQSAWVGKRSSLRTSRRVSRNWSGPAKTQSEAGSPADVRNRYEREEGGHVSAISQIKSRPPAQEAGS